MGFLLRIPSGVGLDELLQGYYLNSGYYMTVFMVQPLQTMSAGTHGSHPHTQSSALVLQALLRLVPPGEPESSLLYDVVVESTDFLSVGGLCFLSSFHRAH